MDISRITLAAPTPQGPPTTPTRRLESLNTPPVQAVASDSFKIQLRQGNTPATTIRFAPPPASAQNQFGVAVRVDQPRQDDGPKLLGFLRLTDNQREQIQSAESRAFDRFMYASNHRERGSLNAKLMQANTAQMQPGYRDVMGAVYLTDGEKDQLMDALKDYGEDLAAIGISGRDKRALQHHLEDKFFITLFDRDKDEFEDYFKDGVEDFFGDKFGQSAPHVKEAAAVQSSSASSENLVDVPDEKPKSQYKWRWFRPRLSVSASGLDYEKIRLKPKVDLVRLRGPAHTDLRLEAELPYRLDGEFTPEIQITGRRILNHTPGEYGSLTDNLYAEGRAEYNFEEERLRATLGVRKHISPDSSMGAYGLYSQSLNGSNEDIAVGVNYQNRWN